MADYDYDMLVIGSGPAGQRAAIQSAKLGKRAALIERKSVIGGVCTNTGTIPSKTLREAVLYLSGYRQRSIYGESYTVKQNITVADLLFRTEQVIRHEIDVTRHQLLRNGVEVINAEASFVGPHSLHLEMLEPSGERNLSSENILLAVGTEATGDPKIPFDGQNIFLSDDILRLRRSKDPEGTSERQQKADALASLPLHRIKRHRARKGFGPQGAACTARVSIPPAFTPIDKYFQSPQAQSQ